MKTWIAILAVICPVFLSPAARSSPAPGPLRVHPHNPRYFTDDTKLPDGSWKAVYLTGSHTWNNLIDMHEFKPPLDGEAVLYLSTWKAGL